MSWLQESAMHEMSLMNNLMSQIETLAREHDAKTVSGIKIRLGALSHFSTEHFKEHFDIVAKGSLAEGAELDIELLTDENDPLAYDIVLEEIEVDGL
jgi:hydrogenase nickel incorporation protein HypA/HybF